MAVAAPFLLGLLVVLLLGLSQKSGSRVTSRSLQLRSSAETSPPGESRVAEPSAAVVEASAAVVEASAAEAEAAAEAVAEAAAGTLAEKTLGGGAVSMLSLSVLPRECMLDIRRTTSRSIGTLMASSTALGTERPSSRLTACTSMRNDG